MQTDNNSCTSSPVAVFLITQSSPRERQARHIDVDIDALLEQDLRACQCNVRTQLYANAGRFENRAGYLACLPRHVIERLKDIGYTIVEQDDWQQPY